MRCSVLQCVAVCCSVLQCVAVCYNALQCVAVCCSVLQCVAVYMLVHHLKCQSAAKSAIHTHHERWGAGVETQKNVRGVFGGWGRVPFNETYAPSLSTIYDGA